jgi:hypothetical protein
MPDRRRGTPPSPAFDDDVSSDIEDFSDAAAQTTEFLEADGLLEGEAAADGQLGAPPAPPPPPASLTRRAQTTRAR